MVGRDVHDALDVALLLQHLAELLVEDRGRRVQASPDVA